MKNTNQLPKLGKPSLFLFPYILICFISVAQTTPVIDTAIFSDAAHHWYDISEKGNYINPRPGHPKYNATETVNIADNILLYQKDNGGWPKNYDMQAILSAEQKDSLLLAKKILNTTFDNRTTYSQIGVLGQSLFLHSQRKV